MQTINCLLKLNGENDMVIPKFGITVAEARILQHIHGEDAVVEVEPAGEVDTDPRAEREELILKYPAKVDKPSIAAVAFSVLSQVPETLADLNLHDEQMRVEKRVAAPRKARGKKAEAPVKDDVDPFLET